MILWYPVNTKLTVKSETGNYLFKILISLKTVGNLFDNFNDETVDHVEIKLSCIVENARNSLYVHYLSVICVGK